MIQMACPTPTGNYLHWLYRAPGALGLALMVTAGLFLLMKALITTHQLVLNNAPSYTVNIVKPRKMDPVHEIKRDPTKPEPPTELPHAPKPTFTQTGTGPDLNGKLPPIDKPKLALKTNLSDGAFLPIVRVQPRYPVAAMRRGIEGYTVVAFDLAADGSVHNPRVVEHSPSGVFDAASIRAIKHFRFKPGVVDGKPVPTYGIRYRFTFELSSASL